MLRFSFGRLPRRVTLCLSALIATALISAGPVLAKNPNTDPPKLIEVDVAGQKQNDGNFLWQYDVYTGTQPNLSHWVLPTCIHVFQDIVKSSSMIEWANPDNKTQATGIKFDDGGQPGQIVDYSFETSKDWEAGPVTAYFFGGNINYTYQTTGPSCTDTPATPEPGTLALLVTGSGPLLLAFRRRRG